MRKIYTPLSGVMLTLFLLFSISEITFANKKLNSNMMPLFAASDISITAAGSTTICQGGSVDLSVDSGYSSYLWSTGETTSAINVNSAGSFFVAVVDSLANTLFSDTVTVTVGSPAIANAGTDVMVCGNNTLGLDGSVSGTASSGTWIGGTNASFLDGRNQLDGGYLADLSEYGGNVQLILMTNDPGNGCPAGTDTLNITVLDVPDIQPIPNQANFCPFTVFDLASINVVDANNTVGIYAYQDALNQPLASSVVTASGIYYIVKATVTTPTCFDFEPVTVTITNCSCNLILSKTFVNTTCPGSSNGSIDLTVTGGATPYSYIWTTGDTTQDLNNLPAGFYSVVVTDAFSCMDTVNVTISEQSALNASCILNNDVTCFGGADGLVSVSALGGVNPISYQWKDGGGNNVGSNLPALLNIPADTYTVIATDNVGCVDSCSVTVTEPNQVITLLNATTCDPLLAGIDTVILNTPLSCDSLVITTTTLIPFNVSVLTTPETCTGNNGTARALATGGVQPYTYQWSNGQSTSIVSGLSAGAYSVIVTGFCTDTVFFNIGDSCNLNPLTCNITSTNACNGANNGTATANHSGGNAPFTYLWSNNETTQTINGLSTGIYTVVITEGSGATSSCSTTITLSPSISFNSPTITNIACNGDASGAINISVTGGASPYTFLWSNNSTIEDQSALTAGIYFVTATDIAGCSLSASYIVTENSAMVVGNQVTNVSCHGSSDGVAVVQVNGGVPPYTYLWNTTPAQTNFIATGLSAGQVSVTITDNAGCVTSHSIMITQPATLDASVSITNISCNGANDGSVSVNPIGGTPYASGSPYVYSWNTIPTQTTQTATGLGGGFHTVIISDSVWCSKTVVVSINEPDVLMVSINPFNVTCNGGSNGKGTAIPSGGTPPYTYLWSNTQTNQVATNLTAGVYSVTVTDVNNCSANASITITESAAISVNAVLENVSCGGAADGKITLNVSGGTSPYNFLWNTNPAQTTSIASGLGAGTYSVVITDANGCQYFDSYTISNPNPINPIIAETNVTCNNGNDGSLIITSFTGGVSPFNILWSNGNSTMNNSGLTAGTYYLTVTDAVGCIHLDTVQVTEPVEIVCNAILNDATCNSSLTASILTTVTGGTSPYTFNWSNGSTGSNLLNIGAGTYSIVITDDLGCTKSESYIINEPSILTLSNSVTNVSCNGESSGSVTANPGGGTPPYAYSWSNGQSTQTANGLVAGVYTLSITDANGCVKFSNITITEPPVLVVSCTSINSNCSASNNGSVTATVSGGSPGYTYSWNSVPVQTTQTAINLAAGIYIVTITDQNNCTATSSCSVIISGNLSCTTTSTNASCHGASDGSASVTATGGDAPYSYNWNTVPAQNTQSATGLGAGIYVALITDANGCTTTCSAEITEPQEILTNINVTNVTCNGLSNGTATANVTGGTAPYDYLWSNGTTIATTTGLSNGSYTLTVTDANNCESNILVLITQPNPIECSIINTPVTCNGGNNGIATVSASGGMLPYTYAWSTSPVQNTVTATGLTAGIYIVTITDGSGCTSTCSTTITEPSALVCSTAVIQDVSCINNTDGIAQAFASGGTGPYTYSWNTIPVQTTSFATNLASGSHLVTITDANGCMSSCSVLIGTGVCVNVGDFTWIDVNGNGIFDSGEPAVGGVLVTLHDSTGAIVGTMTTDSSGAYLFTNVLPGDYYVTFGNVPGYTYTVFNAAGSQVSGANGPGTTNTFTVANTDVLTIDQGYLGTGIIGDFVWEDLNNNGIQDDGPTGIANAVVQLTWAGPDGILGTTDDVISTDTTDANGGYLFSNLPMGNYEVMVLDGGGTVLAGLTNTTGGNTTTTSLTPGSPIDLTQDFGYVDSVNVGDFTWIDVNGNGIFDSGEPAVGGVLVTLHDSTGAIVGTMTTDSSGAYLFTNVLPGDYYVTFGNVPGYTYTVFNAAGSQVSGANGPGTTNTFTVANTDVLTIDQGYLGTGIIGDFVWEDLNNNGIQDDGPTGIANAVVQLTWAGPDGILGTTDDVISTDTTDANGGYLFSNLPMGNYEVMVLDGGGTVLAGLTNTTGGNTTTTSLTPGSPIDLTQDFGYVDSVNVGDFTWIDVNGNGIFDSGEPAVGGVLVTLHDSTGAIVGTMTTDSSGAYLFTNVLPGDYYVTFGNVPGYTYTVFNAAGSQVSGANGPGTTNTFTVANTDVLTIDQGYLGTGIIGDFVWEDLNNNGIQDDGPTGIANAVVQLTWAGPDGILGTTDDVISTDTTDANGGYLFTNLPMGNYEVMVLDGGGTVLAGLTNTTGGNTTTTSLTPGSPTDLTQDFGYNQNCVPATLSAQPSNVLCNGDSTGSIILTVTGGTLPLTYQWSNGSNTKDLLNVPSGIYIVTVTSNGGCSASTSAFVGQNSLLSCDITDASCSIDFSLSQLQAGEIVTEQYSNLGIHISGTGNQGLPDAVIVYDSNDSTQTLDPDLQVGLGNLLILPSDLIDANNDSLVDFPDDSQFGGTITFLFDDPVNISSMVFVDQDDSNLPIVNAYDSLNNLVATATVPQLGDMSVQTLFLNASNVSRLEIISFASVAIGPIEIECNLGSYSATVNPTGGVGPYTYSWNTTPVQTTQTIEGIDPGTYVATVTDFYGCTTSCDIIIGTPCPKIAINIRTYNGGRNVSCDQSVDGEIFTLVNGGTAPYSYQWSNGETTADLSSLSAGTYMLSVSDNAGCQFSKTAVLTEPNPLSCAIDDLSNVGCNGGSDGSISVNVIGGNGPYESYWNTNPSVIGTELNNISAGFYTLTVVDTNGCTDINTYEITEPRKLAAWTKWVNPLCHGDANGSINLFVRKGTAPYTYLWNDGVTTQDRSGLSAGRYTVSVTDANGCRKKQSRYIIQPAILKNIAHVTHVSCRGGNDASVDLTIRGGVAPYTYLWADGTTIKNRANLTSGWYPVTVTDNNGCTVYKNIKINQPALLTLNVTTQDVTIQGGNDGAASGVAAGGVAPYTYLWSKGSTDASISGLVAGTYTITVTDDKGCTSIESVTISEPIITGPFSCNALGSTISCGTATGTATVTATGGFPPYDYFWNTNPPQTTATATGLPAGTYVVQVSDSRGSSSAIFCFATITCTNVKTISPIMEERSQLSVYPNPFTNELNLNVWSAFDDEKFDVQVIDMLGKSVYLTKVATDRGISIHKIDLDNLPNGIYFVKLKSNYSSFVQRLIKQ